MGRYGNELAAGMVGVAALRRGQTALDVGCGTGALTATLSALLGADNVAAIDPSERFLAVCRSRVPGADVREGVAEELPFADGEFDAVLAQLVVDGMVDARQGVAEMCRVARPGGVVAACVWDFDGGMPLLNTVWAAALDHDPDGARSFGADRRRPFSRPDELEDLWSDSGLDQVAMCGLVAGAEYEGIDDLWAPFAAGVGNLGSFVESLDDPQREQLKRDVERRFGSPQGPFRLTARAVCARGVAPSGS